MRTSEFASLWIDQPDALQQLDERVTHKHTVTDYREKIAFFIEHGYVIFEKAVSDEAIDRYLAEFEQALQPDSGLLASVPTYGPQDKSLVAAAEASRYEPLTKYLDSYWLLPSARPLVFNEQVATFLRIVFEERPLAFQGLHFEVGSTQAIHQDTAYVVADKPLALVASWLALEDIQPGSGELLYYEGSHRLPDWKYSGKYKHYNHARDAHQEHIDHLESLHRESQARNYPLRRFLPRKGDLLLWAADLAHGGAEIEKPGTTRRSLVTHFCPASVAPNYFHYLPPQRQVLQEYGEAGAMSTFYYEGQRAAPVAARGPSSIVRRLLRKLRG